MNINSIACFFVFLCFLSSFCLSAIDKQVHPIGYYDADVYDFIKDYLLNQNKKTDEDVLKLIKQEKELKPGEKPHFVSISEGQMASILTKFCLSNKKLYQITLYKKNGIGIALGNNQIKVSFGEKRRHTLGLGFLDADLMEKANTNCEITYYLKQKGVGTLKETIKAIYLNKKNNYAYFSPQQNSEDEQIGYVSYIVRS